MIAIYGLPWKNRSFEVRYKALPHSLTFLSSPVPRAERVGTIFLLEFGSTLLTPLYNSSQPTRVKFNELSGSPGAEKKVQQFH